MVHVDKFLFLSILVACAYLALRGQQQRQDPQERKGAPEDQAPYIPQQYDAMHIPALSLILVLHAIALITIPIVVLADVLQWDIVQIFAFPGQTLTNFMLAAICGLLVAAIWKVARNKGISHWSETVLYGVPLMLLFMFGFFSGELRSMFAQAVSVKIPYFEVDLERSPTETVTQAFTEGAPRTTTPQSDFQIGVRVMRDTVEGSLRDFRGVLIFCDHFKNLHCHDVRLNDISAMMILRRNTHYAKKSQQWVNCLYYYSQIYENGVPLRDNLTELAAMYSGSMRPNKAIDMIDQVNKITSELKHFYTLIGNANEAAFLSGYLDVKTEKVKKACRGATMTSAETLLHLSPLRPNDRLHSSNLPLKSVFEASLLVAAGYRLEGARHLQREFTRFNYAYKSAFTQDAPLFSLYTDYLAMRLHLRMLGSLSELYPQQLTEERVAALYRVANIVRDWIKHVASLSSTPESFVKSCADGDFRLEMTDHEVPIATTNDRYAEAKILGIKDINLALNPPEKMRDMVQQEIGAYLVMLVGTDLLELWNSAEIMERKSHLIGTSTLDSEILARAKSYYAVAKKNAGALLHQCYQRVLNWGAKRINWQVYQDRFYSMAVLGMFEAADTLQGLNATAIGGPPAHKKGFCRARAMMAEAIRIGRSVLLGATDVDMELRRELDMDVAQIRRRWRNLDGVTTTCGDI